MAEAGQVEAQGAGQLQARRSGPRGIAPPGMRKFRLFRGVKRPGDYACVQYIMAPSAREALRLYVLELAPVGTMPAEVTVEQVYESGRRVKCS